MKSLYLINERISLKKLSAKESLGLQEKSILTFIQNEGIQIVPLNPYQCNPYYTIPHALLYDLTTKKESFDSLIMYSEEVIAEFIESYPAKWLILKSYFNEIIFIHYYYEKQKSQGA